MAHVMRVAGPSGSIVSAPVERMLYSGNVSAYSTTWLGSTRVNSMLPLPCVLLSHAHFAPMPNGGPEYLIFMVGSRRVQTLQFIHCFGSTT